MGRHRPRSSGSLLQEQLEQAKTFPWPNAANMRWPLLTTATMQFNARMYPAVVKGDEAVLCKIIGQDNGKPVTAPNPVSGEIQPVPQLDPRPASLRSVPDGQVQLQPQWLIPPGAKAKRAERVSDYLNTTIFYRMENWEDDTDALLMQLPATGCVFRKTWYADGLRPRRSRRSTSWSRSRPATSRPRRASPRRSGTFSRTRSPASSGSAITGPSTLACRRNRTAPRKRTARGFLLEQHCLWDFDDDGLPEPYIVTVDHQTRLCFGSSPTSGPDDIEWRDEEQTDAIASAAAISM
jgi:chaperonin GroES